MANQYGLIHPKKTQLSAPKSGNVFGNNSDSEDEEGTDWVKKSLKVANEKNKVKRQTQLTLKKALEEDPTIFQYDEVYDEMEKTKEEEKLVKKEKKAPKYINNLMKHAELRKKEQELIKEKMIQKEIEAENAMFKDKERFITSSYKAKLEEMKKFEEEQEYKDKLEAFGDVTKQNDMTGFYRHLYRQTVERNDADLGIKPEPKEESNEKKDDVVQSQTNIDKDDPIPFDSESEKSDDENATNFSKSSSKEVKNKRQYRVRATESSSESEDEEIATEREKESTENIDQKDQNVTSEPENKKRRLSDNADEKKAENNSSVTTNETIKKDNKNLEKTEEGKENKNKEKENKSKEPKEQKPKVNIYEKRTVGPVFEAALNRYLMRKQSRLNT